MILTERAFGCLSLRKSSMWLWPTSSNQARESRSLHPLKDHKGKYFICFDIFISICLFSFSVFCIWYKISSVVPFSSCLQSFPALGSFPMSQLFASGGQGIGVSASTSALPMNIQDYSPLGWTDWFPCCPRDSQESSPTPQVKSINSSALSFLSSPTLTSRHDYWKNHSFD